MNKYEVMYVLDAALEDQARQDVISRFSFEAVPVSRADWTSLTETPSPSAFAKIMFARNLRQFSINFGVLI